MTSYQNAFLADFACLGDTCEDTCCKGWGMQLTQQTVDKYKAEAPELMDAVDSGEAEFIMKRDPETDYCVKFDNGWCGVHAARGTDFLGDACHFFPRVTRQLGDDLHMTASVSCPEVVRLALLKEGGFAPQETSFERTPHSLKDYTPEGLPQDKALEVHQQFIALCDDESKSPERLISIIRSGAESLSRVDNETWGIATSFYLSNAEATLPNAEGNIADPFNLLNALQGLIGASRKTKRPRLDDTLTDMEQALSVTLNWETLAIETGETSAQDYDAMHGRWYKEWSAHFAPILRRWIQAQLSVALFPYAGFGETLADRATILGIRFATIKLALMSACHVKGGLVDDEQTVRIIQSLARFLDHLADPTLSMQIYTETGWVRESRLRALVGDY